MTRRSGIWWLALAACGLDELDHEGSSGQLVGGAFVDGGVDGGGMFGSAPSSNFPEPAETICGTLPDGLRPIADLRSAWVVVAVPGATDPSGTPVVEGTARVRLSDRRQADCTDAFEDGPPEIEDELARPWGLALTLSADEFVVGAHGIRDLADPRAERYDGTRSRAVELSGTVELLQVTPDCVIGTVYGLPRPRDTTVADGGFVAQVCTRTCVPDVGGDCWERGNSDAGGT